MHRPLQPIDNKQAFEMLLLKRECASNKQNCNKDCESCNYYVYPNDEICLIDYLVECLKGKEPTLYFCDHFTVLTEILNRRSNDELKNQETK